MSTVVLLSRALLAVVFAAAGAAKLRDLEGSRNTLREFGIPDGIARPSGTLLPLAELATAVALVFRPSAQWGAGAALLLLLVFIAGISNVLRKGQAPPCNCFGQIHSEPVGRTTLARNAVLAVIAAIAVVKGPGPAIDGWVRSHSAGALIAVVVGAAVLLLAAVLTQRQKSAEQLQRERQVANTERRLTPPGLPVGTDMPDFTLTNLDGETVTLAELRDGRPLLLLFVGPFCNSCDEIFPDIHRWQRTLEKRLAIAIVSGGELEKNRALRDKYDLRTVLVQNETDIVDAFNIRGTPTALLVGSDGKIAAPAAESVFGIEPLIRLVIGGGDVPAITEGSVV